MKLEINRRDGSGALLPRHLRVLLDGRDISHHVLKVELSIAPDDINKATLTLLPDEIIVDADVLLALQAMVPVTKGGTEP
jgi:hypothetical protein